MSTNETKREHRPAPEVLEQIRALLLTPNDAPRYTREVLRRSPPRGVERRPSMVVTTAES